MSESPDSNRPFTVLVLNGGGIRGYTSLCVLEELESQIKKTLKNNRQANQYSEQLRPCMMFNFIAGVSTGAIIALMLGRLEMTIAECKEAYQDLAQTVFGDGRLKTMARLITTSFKRDPIDVLAYRYSPIPLEAAIEQFLRKHDFAQNISLLPVKNEDLGRKCKVLIPVIEVTQLEGQRTTKVRIIHTDPDENVSEKEWTVKETILAATAAPTYFPGYQHPSGRAFIDAAFDGYNNPSVLIYKKMKDFSRHRREALILDVGTGCHNRIALPFKTWKNIPTIFSWVLQMPTDPNPPASEAAIMCNAGQSEAIYYRLDVNYPDTWKAIKTHHYKKIDDIRDNFTSFVKQDALRNTIAQVSQRIVEVLRNEYNNKGGFTAMQERMCDQCNRANPNDSSSK
ncbi:acyl transferase/acyl hydrolase/lysophospholipase [Pyronema domesticum]|nr:acyl transferase/acyl hydrolase/lysophospholipase [Pyronema domesticum]